jgi:hypothetical protein
MTGDQHQQRRTIQACRRAGLPVVDDGDCTCGLRGRLVVMIARSGGLEVVWPYDRRCPIHGRRDRARRQPGERALPARSAFQSSGDARARPKAVTL